MSTGEPDVSPEPGRFDGRVAIVTGASRGVGAATAVALGALGCSVVCAARSTEASPKRLPGTLEATAAAVRAAGGDALVVPTDLTDEDAVVTLVAAAVEHYGRLDHLVNNAAVTFVGDLGIARSRYDVMMAVNLRAPMVAMREAAPHLAVHGGSVVNVSSAAALLAVPGLAVYGMSKLALEHLTLDAAKALAPRVAVNAFRIDVNVASEGYVDNTPGADHDSWEPSEVAADGIVWLLGRPRTHSGQLESMWDLRRREGIMVSRAPRPVPSNPPRRLVTGI
jgi:NAD(P)-dependent dehydrogenase (short-subunit alcohol dehydrogenase family)